MNRTRGETSGAASTSRRCGERTASSRATSTRRRAAAGARRAVGTVNMCRWAVDVNVRLRQESAGLSFPRRQPYDAGLRASGVITRMDFHDTAVEADFRREIRAFIAARVPGRHQAARLRRDVRRRRLGRHPPLDRRVPRSQRGVGEEARRPRLDRARLAEGVRRRRHVRHGAVHLQPGDGLRRRAARRQLRHRHRLGRPDDHPLRHRRRRSRSTCRRIVKGDAIWCQGFSEPGAGSDLASLQTRAVRTATTTSSTARRSGRRARTSPHYMILLARTDPDAPKHRASATSSST